jgi:hypothetical protein
MARAFGETIGIDGRLSYDSKIANKLKSEFRDYVDGYLENSQDIKLLKDYASGRGFTIDDATIPGLTPSDGAGLKNGGATGAGLSTAESIATGGTRSTTINITLRNMVENIVYNGGFDENRAKTKEDLVELLLSILQMSYTTV